MSKEKKKRKLVYNNLLVMTFILLSILLLVNVSVFAQTTETFETESNGTFSFTDNGQVFNISSSGNKFKIQGAYPSTGWNGTTNDNKYIDNDGDAFKGVSTNFTISSSGAVTFKVNSFWLYLADHFANVNVSGTVTVVGKLAGITKFTATASSGFNQSIGVNNGYSLINLNNFGGANNSGVSIDQLSISTTGSFEYVGLDAFTWTVSSPLAASIISQTNLTCYGGSNGSATVSASGGTGPYTFSWAPSGGNNATANGLLNGNYSCNITDAVGVTVTKIITITQPTALLASALSQTNVSCNGGSNGSARVTVSGGTPSYTFNWTPGNPTGDGSSIVSGLSAGTWTCNITDANSCTTTRSFTITQPTALVTSVASQTNVSCYGGSNGTASISVSGGTTAYSYDWTPGNPSGDGTAAVTGLSAGVYTCTITDANSCTTTRSFTITQPTALVTSVASQTNVSCYGGSNGTASISVSGGTTAYSYDWTPGNPSGDGTAAVTGLSAGVYTCTITDANSCTTNGSFTITEPPIPPAPTASVTAQPSCTISTGTIKVSSSTSSLTFSIDGSNYINTNGIFTGVIAGTYSVSSKNNSGCASAATVVTVTPQPAIPSVPVITAASATAFCLGGSVTLSSNASTGNQWYKNNVIITGATNATFTTSDTGSYTDSVSNSVGCKTGSLPTVVTLKPSLAKPTISWNGSNLSTSSTAASYQWFLNSASVSGASTVSYKPTAIGSYKIQVTNAEGCNTMSDSFNLVVTALNNPATTSVSNLATIFPNPASPVLRVKFRETPSSTLEIRLVTIDGKIIQLVKTKEKLTTIPIMNLPSGNYFIRITGNNYNQTESVIINK